MSKREDTAMQVLTETHTVIEQRNYTGSFCGFVLLSSPEFDLHWLAERLQTRWGIAPVDAPQADEFTVEGGQDGDWLDALLAEESVEVLTEPEIAEGNLVFDIPGAMVMIGFLPMPIPDGEAERFAAKNTQWPGAVQAAQEHKAHLMVAVLPREILPVEAGKIYVQILSTCLEADNAVGVYTSGTVLEPAFYQQGVAAMEAGELPLQNWIYVGCYENENGNNAYTLGMDAFGKDEFEILGSSHTLEELRALLNQVTHYVLRRDVTLHDGETIGFAAGQQLPLKRGDGVAVEGHSIQIGY